MKFDQDKAYSIIGTCRPEALGRIAKGLGVTAEAIMIKEASQ